MKTAMKKDRKPYAKPTVRTSPMFVAMTACTSNAQCPGICYCGGTSCLTKIGNNPC